MSLCPQPLPPVPDDTARIARAAFRRGNPYMLLRDRLGAVFADADFADLYPKRGQPAYVPWRLALVTLMQFREGLSDRQAAEAVRGRIDWKYLLALDLADAGFDFSVLCEFRARLLQHGAAESLLARLLDAAREGGLLKARGRSRTDSTHVLAAVRDLNRLELLGETLRAALNAITIAVPHWLRALAPAEWHERYDRRVEDMRLPDAGPKRDAYAVQVGADGFLLLDALDGAEAPAGVRDLSEVGVLRRVWARHFERGEAGSDGGGSAGERASRTVRLRPAQGRGPGDRLESPYDTEARFRSKAGTTWTGYMVHTIRTQSTQSASRCRWRSSGPPSPSRGGGARGPREGRLARWARHPTARCRPMPRTRQALAHPSWSICSVFVRTRDGSDRLTDAYRLLAAPSVTSPAQGNAPCAPPSMPGSRPSARNVSRPSTASSQPCAPGPRLAVTS